MAQFFQVRHSVEDPDDPKGLCRISQLAGAIIVVVGTAVLAGWAFNVARLKTVMPGWAKMSPMTALAFVSSGAALWCIAGLLLKGPGHGDGTRSVTQRGSPQA